jgi:hypothetical protein
MKLKVLILRYVAYAGKRKRNKASYEAGFFESGNLNQARFINSLV